MAAPQLQLPASLQKLIDSAVWPVAANSVVRQELNTLLGLQAARKLSPIDDKIILMPPPFHTIADEVAGGNSFWTDFLTNVGAIDYAKALIVADFGMGTDSPIILYYDTPEPSVLYLHWSGGGSIPLKHTWVRTHPSFDAFAKDVELSTTLIHNLHQQ